MSTIKMIATLHIAAESKNKLESHMLEQMVPASRAEAGCIQYDISAIDPQGVPGIENTGGDFVVIEEWQDMDALQAHTGSEHFQEFSAAFSEDELKVTLQILNEMG